MIFNNNIKIFWEYKILYSSIVILEKMSDTVNSEPLLTPDVSRYVMFPVKDHDIWTMYKKSVDLS